VNNVAVLKTKCTETVDGHEMNMKVNYLVPLLLTHLLLDHIPKDGGRIIIVVSELYTSAKLQTDNLLLQQADQRYSAGTAYTHSKLAGILFTKELSKRLCRTGNHDERLVYALHPGVLATDALREYPRLLIKTVNWFFGKTTPGRSTDCTFGHST
jgi:NAD(P)-dependent dehydrogenase (short-subunit alcohol dehydrogenase family)